MLKNLLIICLILQINSAFANIKEETLDYQKSIVKYYHAGAQIKIKLRNLPNDISQITLSSTHKKNKPKVFLIGSRLMKPKNDNSIDFSFKLEDLKAGTNNTQSAEILITLFKKEQGHNIVFEKAKFFVRSIICSDSGNEVCASVIKPCHKGRQNCVEQTIYKTYKNRCQMQKEEAQMIYSGACKENLNE